MSFCPNYTGGNEVLLDYSEKILVVAVYSCLAIVAIGGNATVIFIVFYFPKMRASTTNYFIINLACADILMAVMCIPFSYWPTLILQYWPFGAFMCKLISFSKVVSILLSAHTLSVISVDRLIAVMHPLRRPLTQRWVLMILACVWIMDMIVSCPMLIVAGILQIPIDNETYQEQCSEKWHDYGVPRGGFFYSSTLLGLQYFFPLCIMFFSYGAIGCKLWLSKSPGECAAEVDRGRKGTTKKIIIMMMLVSTMYAVCYLPQNAFNISWTLCEKILRHSHVLYIWWGCHYMAMLQCSLNPIIYVTASQRYREGFSYVFQWCPCVRYTPHHLTVSQQRTLTFRSASTRSNSPWRKGIGGTASAPTAETARLTSNNSSLASRSMSFKTPSQPKRNASRQVSLLDVPSGPRGEGGASSAGSSLNSSDRKSFSTGASLSPCDIDRLGDTVYRNLYYSA